MAKTGKSHAGGLSDRLFSKSIDLTSVLAEMWIKTKSVRFANIFCILITGSCPCENKSTEGAM